MTKINADARFQAPIDRDVLREADNAALNSNRAPDRLDSARDSATTPSPVLPEDTASVLAHQLGDPTVAQIKCTDRALLVQRRKAAEAGDIGGKDGCKLSIHSGDAFVAVPSLSRKVDRRRC